MRNGFNNLTLLKSRTKLLQYDDNTKIYTSLIDYAGTKIASKIISSNCGLSTVLSLQSELIINNKIIK